MARVHGKYELEYHFLQQMYTLENEDNGSGEVLMLVKYLLKKHEALYFCLGRMA